MTTSRDEGSPKPARADRLVWIDVATTSADPAEASLVEVALAITDNELRVVAETSETVIALDASELGSMDAVLRARHEGSGLLARIPEVGIPLETAEKQLLELLETHCEAGSTPLCGHEVWKARTVLRRVLPKVVDYLHYRLVELTTIEALAERWYPDGPPPLDRELRESPLRSNAEVLRAIARLRAYREEVMAPALSSDTTPAPPPSMD